MNLFERLIQFKLTIETDFIWIANNIGEEATLNGIIFRTNFVKRATIVLSKIWSHPEVEVSKLWTCLSLRKRLNWLSTCCWPGDAGGSSLYPDRAELVTSHVPCWAWASTEAAVTSQELERCFQHQLTSKLLRGEYLTNIFILKNIFWYIYRTKYFSSLSFSPPNYLWNRSNNLLHDLHFSQNINHWEDGVTGGSCCVQLLNI